MIDISHVPANTPLKIIIGAGTQSYPGWIATNREQLDLRQREDWVASLQQSQKSTLSPNLPGDFARRDH